MYELDDELLTLAERARKLIAEWADAAGGWDRAMGAAIESVLAETPLQGNRPPDTAPSG